MDDERIDDVAGLFDVRYGDEGECRHPLGLSREADLGPDKIDSEAAPLRRPDRGGDRQAGTSRAAREHLPRADLEPEPVSDVLGRCQSQLGFGHLEDSGSVEVDIDRLPHVEVRGQERVAPFTIQPWSTR